MRQKLRQMFPLLPARWRRGSGGRSAGWPFTGPFWVGAFLLFMLVMVGCAAWYTSRPQFCNSCHIMEPYYASWQQSSHKDVSCIECHFPPGIGGEVRGKMLGLVQVAKYVTQSAGPGPRPKSPTPVACGPAAMKPGSWPAGWIFTACPSTTRRT